MAATFSLELSDDLHELRGLLLDYCHEPRILDPQDARVMVECCKQLELRARELENEVSKFRWNEQARRDNARHLTHELLDVATRPGSNVKLFPVIRRPVPPSAPTGAA